MAIRNIVKDGDPILNKVCRTVLNFDEKLALLLDDMVETMHSANGVGLAGPQVGMLKRVCVVDIGDGDVVELVNPVITEQSGEQIDNEGCLSCPNVWGMVKRPMNVTVKAQDRNGNNIKISAEGFKARAFCHEIDHLNGILFKTKIIPEK